MSRGRYRIILRPRAQVDLAREGLWWRLHRREAAELFLIEYRSALGVISEQPHGGTPYAKRPGVRQMPMLKTRHVIFYRVDTASREVNILAIWHMARGTMPRL